MREALAIKCMEDNTGPDREFNSERLFLAFGGTDLRRAYAEVC